VGIAVGYRANIANTDASLTNHDFSGGLFYTGRHNLVLGVDASMRYDTTKNTQLIDTLGRIVLRYYW
jgi:hypothetical protein